MLSLIEKLRARPVEVRRRVAWTISIVVTAIIFFVWLSFFVGDESEKSDPVDVAKSETNTVFDSFSIITDGIGETYVSAKNGFKDILGK